MTKLQDKVQRTKDFAQDVVDLCAALEILIGRKGTPVPQHWEGPSVVKYASAKAKFDRKAYNRDYYHRRKKRKAKK